MTDQVFFGSAADIARILDLHEIWGWVVWDCVYARLSDLSAVIEAADAVVKVGHAAKSKDKALALDAAKHEGCRIVLLETPDGYCSVPDEIARLLAKRSERFKR